MKKAILIPAILVAMCAKINAQTNQAPILRRRSALCRVALISLPLAINNQPIN
jgi:hypothetical protein